MALSECSTIIVNIACMFREFRIGGRADARHRMQTSRRRKRNRNPAASCMCAVLNVMMGYFLAGASGVLQLPHRISAKAGTLLRDYRHLRDYHAVTLRSAGSPLKRFAKAAGRNGVARSRGAHRRRGVAQAPARVSGGEGRIARRIDHSVHRRSGFEAASVRWPWRMNGLSARILASFPLNHSMSICASLGNGAKKTT